MVNGAGSQACLGGQRDASPCAHQQLSCGVGRRLHAPAGLPRRGSVPTMEASPSRPAMPRPLPSRISTRLLVAIALSSIGAASIRPAQALPLRGGVGGAASGVGVLPGAGAGQAGPGLVKPAPLTPAAGGVGGAASGVGVLPGAGAGQAGPGLVRPAPVAPAAGGVGGPGSGAGILPGAGLGRPGLGR